MRENTERTPQVAVIEATETGIQVRTIKLRVPPASEVFDFERKEKQETETERIDHFIDQLGASLNADPTLDVDSQVQALSFATDVRDRALSYLDKARAES